ncbi:basic region leucine zipper [Colletotrichum falcatum]|nr:basic region leucine zipper [Colletotrichum falcatum]
MSFVQWDAERQNGPTPNCTTVSWSMQPGDWSSYQQQQQYLQSPQPIILGPPLQWPASACDPLSEAPALQAPPFQDHNRSQLEVELELEPKHRAIATRKRATKPARKSADLRFASMSRNHPKKARAGTGGASESHPVSSVSYWGNGARADDGNKGEDSDASTAPAGPSRKKPYRIKNRAAAKRCREKTKQYEIYLSNREKQVTEERMYLDACVTALKNEVLSLKNHILQHGSCDCDMIQGYISRTATAISVSGHGVPMIWRPSQLEP